MERSFIRDFPFCYPLPLNVSVIALHCIVFELQACENSAEFPVESGCKANALIRYKNKVDRPTACRVLPYYVEYRPFRSLTVSGTGPKW